MLDLLVLGVAGWVGVVHVAGRALRGVGAGHRAVLLGQEAPARPRLWRGKATVEREKGEKKTFVKRALLTGG